MEHEIYTTEVHSNPEKNENERTSKVILFVRHPSIKFFDCLMEKAEDEGRDVTTYLPLDIKGIKMARYLGNYFEANMENIAESVPCPRSYNIYSSPLPRAESTAEIVTKNLKLAHLSDPTIPLPLNNQPIESENLQEIFWMGDREETADLLNRAKELGVRPIELWFEDNPERVRQIILNEIPKAQGVLRELQEDKTPMSIVFTHAVKEALILWLIEERNNQREDFAEISGRNLERIKEITIQLGNASITEIRQFEQGDKKHWSIISVGKDIDNVPRRQI